MTRLTAILSAALLALPATLRAADTNTGRLTGFVRLTGPAPVLSNRIVTVDLALCGNQARPLQSLLLGSNQTVRDAVVWLDAPATDLGPPASALLDQRQCEFVPRVQLARAGAPCVLKNSDPTLHVVQIGIDAAQDRRPSGTSFQLVQPEQWTTKMVVPHTNGLPAWWSVAAPYAGFAATNQLPATREPLWLRAGNRNGHEWMTAFIIVMPHPWAALTGDRGEFYFRAIPAGNHTLRVWHEVLGTLTVPVTIRAGATTSIVVEFRRDLPPRSD